MTASRGEGSGESAALRVLHLSSGNLYGGIETLLRTFAMERSACPGMAPEFAFVADGRIARELREAGVPVHTLGAVRVRYPWTVLRARRGLKKLLAARRFEVAVCHGPWPHGLYARTVRAAGVPLAYFQHGISEGAHWTERWAHRTPPDLLLATSQGAARSAAQLFRGMKPVVVHNPVPAPPAKTHEERAQIRRGLRARWQTPDDAAVILQVSRMEPGKGHRLLLEGLARMRTGAPWTTWIAGGAQRAEEEAYVRELHAAAERLGIAGRVRWLGQSTNVPELMMSADLFCHPNLAPESFGIVFVEALAQGLPVVTTAHGGALEIIDPTCGVLVPPDAGAGALAQVLDGLLDDPARRKKLGEGGPARARQISDITRQLTLLSNALASIAHSGT